MREDVGVPTVRVEVFPIAEDRWIGVIDAEGGAFSTECSEPGEMWRVAARDASGVLGLADLAVELVDDLGQPWTPEGAPAQLRRFAEAGAATSGRWKRP